MDHQRLTNYADFRSVLRGVMGNKDRTFWEFENCSQFFATGETVSTD